MSDSPHVVCALWLAFNSKFLSTVVGHTDQWDMKNHKEWIWKICVAQLNYMFPPLLQIISVYYFICVGYIHVWISLGSMRNWKEQDGRQQLMQVLRHLLQCPKCWDCHGTNLRKVLDSTVTRYRRTQEQDLFEILSDLSLTPSLTHLYRYHYFTAYTYFYHHMRLVLAPHLCSRY